MIILEFYCTFLDKFDSFGYYLCLSAINGYQTTKWFIKYPLLTFYKISSVPDFLVYFPLA